MKPVVWGGYVVAVLVISIFVEVAARWDSAPSRDSAPPAALAPIPPLQPAPPPVVPDHANASAGSCDKLFAKQKALAVELAVSMSGAKNKKARQRIAHDVAAKMNAEKETFSATCATLPQAEVDCVLDQDDPTKWGECGPQVARLGGR